MKLAGIKPDMAVRTFVSDQTITIQAEPSKVVTSKTDAHKAFIKMLQETQGAWGPATAEEKAIERASRRRELREAEKARRAW